MSCKNIENNSHCTNKMSNKSCRHSLLLRSQEAQRGQRRLQRAESRQPSQGRRSEQGTQLQEGVYSELRGVTEHGKGWKCTRTMGLIKLSKECGSDGEVSACKTGDRGSIPELRRSLERACPPTPVFLPGELCGQRRLVGYSPWGCKELDTTEQLALSLILKMMGDH